MREVEDECCGCATESYPCLGENCPNRAVTHFYCDKCEDETKLYEYDGKELCANCILETLQVVEGSDWDA